MKNNINNQEQNINEMIQISVGSDAIIPTNRIVKDSEIHKMVELKKRYPNKNIYYNGIEIIIFENRKSKKEVLYLKTDNGYDLCESRSGLMIIVNYDQIDIYNKDGSIMSSIDTKGSNYEFKDEYDCYIEFRNITKKVDTQNGIGLDKSTGQITNSSILIDTRNGKQVKVDNETIFDSVQQTDKSNIVLITLKGTTIEYNLNENLYIENMQYTIGKIKKKVTETITNAINMNKK